MARRPEGKPINAEREHPIIHPEHRQATPKTQNGTSARPADLGIDDAVEVALANAYFNRLPLIYLGNGAACVGMAVALVGLGVGGVGIWLLLTLGHIVLCRAWTWWPSRQAVVTVERARYWGRYLVGSSLLQGVLWGAAPVLFLPPLVGTAHATTGTTLTTLVMVASVSASMVLLSSQRLAYAANAVPVTLGLGAGLVLMTTEPLASTILALATILLLLTGLHFSRQAHEAQVRTLRLDLEGERLTRDLGRQVAVAEDAVADRTRFMAAASHDLRQPLAALNLFLAQMDTHTSGAGQHLLARSQQTLSRLNALIQGLLDTSRLDAGDQHIALGAFALAPLLDALQDEFEELARSKGLRLHTARTAAWVHGDALQLQRILANLISNALTNTHSGAVLVGVRWRREGWCIEVRDSGPGIAPDQQSLIFREFYQIENPERDARRGVGLGLSIVKRLAALLDAPVALRSAPGAGSTFSVLVPRIPRPAQVVALPARVAPTGAALPSRVLVIEDDQLVTEAIDGLLRSWGCIVALAESAQGAVAAVRSGHPLPDLILSDLRLPGDLNGVEAILAVRSACGRMIPAALITGEPVGSIDLSDVPGVRVLQKPLSPPQLRVLLTTLLRRAS